MTKHLEEVLISLCYFVVWGIIIFLTRGIGFILVGRDAFEWTAWFSFWIALTFFCYLLYTATKNDSEE